MTQEQRTEAMYQAGREQALDLQVRALDMTGTELIAEEIKVPAFVPGKDYSGWPVGSPVADEDQIWTLIQPYDGASNPGHPAELRALWGLCHTKNPADAKAWVDPLGTSGMYMKDECYKAEDGTVYRCLADNTVYDASDFPSLWEVMQS